ncbi:ABC transporter permease [Maribacter litopenaei]|uniref:ABC transporter permease n=1 Tax=Maribacter litopenaei TaxID=2976127 RepID=UPI0030841D11
MCVIGERNVQELFDKDEEPIGQYIRIGDVYFQVVGIHKLSQGVSFDNDTAIFIPFTTFRKLYNTGENVDYFCIAAYDDVDVVQVEKDVKALLRNIHRVNPEDERAFGSFNLGEAFARVSGFAKGMTFLSLGRWTCNDSCRGHRYWKYIIDICKGTYQGIRRETCLGCHTGRG